MSQKPTAKRTNVNQPEGAFMDNLAKEGMDREREERDKLTKKYSGDEAMARSFDEGFTAGFAAGVESGYAKGWDEAMKQAKKEEQEK